MHVLTNTYQLVLSALKCSFTAVTRVQIPSGTPNLIRSLRGTATFAVGTKRHNLVANFWPGLPNRECFRGCGSCSCSTKKAHVISVRSGSRNRMCAANDPTLSSSFVDCESLSVRIQCDSAGSMTQQLLQPPAGTNTCAGKYAIRCAVRFRSSPQRGG